MSNDASKPRSHGNAKSKTDHVRRLIDEHFEESAGELIVGGLPVSTIVQQFGTPLFVYDREILANAVRRLAASLPKRFKLFYSIKANPNAEILRCFLELGCGLEVASAGELHQALNAGCQPEHLLFAGPGKTERDLDAAVSAGIYEIHLESLDEARCLNSLAGRQQRSYPLHCASTRPILPAAPCRWEADHLRSESTKKRSTPLWMKF